MHVKINPRVGTKVTKGEPIGHVETTKGVWEVITPLSGTVVDINPPIIKGNANPIVHEPYGTGWLVELEMADESELKALRNGSEEETKQWIKEKAEELVPMLDEDDDDD